MRLADQRDLLHRRERELSRGQVAPETGRVALHELSHPAQYSLSTRAVMRVIENDRQPQQHIRRDRVAAWGRVVAGVTRAHDERLVIDGSVVEAGDRVVPK